MRSPDIRFAPEELELPGSNERRPQQRRRGKKKLILIITALIVLLGGAGYGGFIYLHRAKPVAAVSSQAPQPPAKTTPAKSDDSEIRILAAGDFIAHDSINMHAKQPDGSYDYMPMMEGFPQIFHASDIRFCNDAQLSGGAAYGISGWPKFNSPTEFATDMGKVGCNIVNTGTNHSFDRTQAAIDASVDAWNKVPDTLAVAGQNKNMQQHDAVHLFTVKGVKFAFLAYTMYLNNDAPAQDDYGVDVFSKDYASKQISDAKAQGAQYIIASIRWGVEYSGTVDQQQKDTAQWLADQGVNLILGHGSHVLEPVQQLTGAGGTKATVFYSLGNFLNTQEPPETLFNGLSLIKLDPKTLQIKSLAFLPIYMHYEWTPTQQKADDLLSRHNIKMYLLENATQDMVDSNQLHTTIADQKDRLNKTLNTFTNVQMITLSQYMNDNY